MCKLKAIVLGLLFLGLLVFVPSARGQSNSYKQTNLSSDTQGTASFTSPNLINPWGMAFAPGTPFWIADNNSGKSTLHDKTGNMKGSFTVPSPAGSSNQSTPTGGYSKPASGGTQRGTTTMMISAQSGSIMHSTSVSLTVQ